MRLCTNIMAVGLSAKKYMNIGILLYQRDDAYLMQGAGDSLGKLKSLFHQGKLPLVQRRGILC